MLFFEKSQPAPQCLEEEKEKAHGDYKCGEVLDRVRDDFKNKCYICESAGPHSINIEHFRPHRGDRDLKFSWANLFWSCAHCNNVKSDRFDNIIDCTRQESNIEDRLRYSFKPFPFEKVQIEALDESTATQSTQLLIESVFNGTTKLKLIESANIRNSLLYEIQDFQRYLTEYFQPTTSQEDKAYFLQKIKSHLHPASSFTSFKRWIIRDNETLSNEFGHYL